MVRLIVRLMGTLVAEITPRIFAVCSEGQDGADSADGCGVTLISRLLQQGGHVANVKFEPMHSGVFTVSAIRNPQIAEEKKPRMDGQSPLAQS